MPAAAKPSRIPLLALAAAGGCYALQPSDGGGDTRFEPPRRIDPADVALAPGYRIEAVATRLTFPTGVAFDGDGRPHVVESGYAYGEVFTTPRLLRIEDDGSTTEVAAGGGNGPWNGVAFAGGVFYVAEGGTVEGGRILRITPEGEIEAIVEDLPSRGDHHTNGPVVAPDGAIVFAVGSATNSGVVGTDNASFGWLERSPEFCDVPGQDVRLRGANFATDDPRTGDPDDRAVTGAFLPFGTASEPMQVIEGRVPCTGGVMRVPPGGGEIELVAWGFRNPFGLAFDAEGTLWVTDNGYDVRGSRPVWGAADVLWRVEPGRWYGWPDFAAGLPLTLEHFEAPGADAPGFVLAEHPGEPPEPVARFAVHGSADGFDFSRAEEFGYVGQAFVALFGDQTPGTGKVLAPVGFKVVRVDVETGVIREFAVNHGSQNGPASFLGSAGLERPVAVRFDPSGQALYVVDFGVLLQDGDQALPKTGTGVLWRITRAPQHAATAERRGAR